ncbi:MAG: hypothetical protein A2X13_00200 [Bacteroidetes bacterium GWC2_33_15]|nr:MAG: hypothetical protein A2X10_04010 [Bacteroidetes bacterium GWA2_33_15]OFX51047.1 MAG: hypothetical protein A2X13_00200 [Bacteroidetes bacterium GWC2_33_15]OFX65670.1 MAG: hypothetical protein A2X15_13820 [Bacteroidetes bacterium GWB2_32_14]OFX70255.1 MAG: hypothetical protein A2X14_03090 [Bacteroidetes bacterium GWD2_33_33]HAN17251.1 hypothetical protein [Bacteroidales bacterium]
MFLYEFKIILRNVFRNKFFSFINIFGLSLGLTATILIMLWVWDELSYDRFYENAGNIYMLINKNYDDQGNSIDFVESPAPMADYLVNNIPDIEKAVRVEYFYTGGLIQKENDSFKEKGASADASFFDIFKIPFIQGDKNNALTNPESIVISENMANRYFGDKNPVGEILKIKASGNVFKTVTITGVYKDFPKNSTIKLDFIVPFLLEEKNYLDNWNVSIYVTFVLLDKNSDLKLINKKVSTIFKDVLNKSQYSSYLFPLVKLHLNSNLTFFNNPNHGNRKLIYILVFIAILILLIASINYMNLTTARSVKKIKDIGIKKVLGISRKRLFSNFLTEAIVFTLISFYIAIILIEVIRPVFNNLTGKNIRIHYFEPQFLLVAIAIISITSFISTYYPYLYITSYQHEIIKGSTKYKPRGISPRKFLVIFQFIISIILIIFSSIILKQINYIYSKNLGFDKENVIMINSSYLGDNVKIFKHEILKNANILSVTNGNDPIGGGWPDSWSWDSKNTSNNLKVIRINSDSDYLNTLKIKLLKGRFFYDENINNSSIVINQKFAEYIGQENIIGKRIFYREKPYEIIGITENFHSHHFSEDIKLAAFFNEPTYQLLIKVKGERMAEIISYIESEYKKIVTDRAFEYSTLAQRFDKLYYSEVRTGKLFCYFSFLAIFISCLGLFGISVFATEQRTKEIGIRKTLGASSSNIVNMLTSEFIKWVVTAYIIACPVAYYIATKWLQNFVYRTQLSWWIFVLSGIIVLVITLLTVSWQSYRVASKNPVESLRYE